MKRPRLILFVPDIHYPYQDKQSLSSVFNLIGDIDTDAVDLTVCQLGDLIDFYSLSSFDKNPNRVLTLQYELDCAREFWPEIRKRCPKAKRVQLGGNHTHRLQRYLAAHPELSTLRCLTLDELFELKKNKVTYHEYGESARFPGGLVATHGSKIARYGGYSANAELQTRWSSGVSGHTHRLGQTYYTTETGHYTWAECGYLGDLDYRKFEYCSTQPNWQQGFAYAYYPNPKRDTFTLTTVPIYDHEFVYHGKVYKP